MDNFHSPHYIYEIVVSMCVCFLCLDFVYYFSVNYNHHYHHSCIDITWKWAGVVYDGLCIARYVRLCHWYHTSNGLVWPWLPSGNLTSLWKITIFNGKIHYKWSFSIATLNYQRVLCSIYGGKTSEKLRELEIPWRTCPYKITPPAPLSRVIYIYILYYIYT